MLGTIVLDTTIISGMEDPRGDGGNCKQKWEGTLKIKRKKTRNNDCVRMRKRWVEIEGWREKPCTVRPEVLCMLRRCGSC